jgi:cobalamin biosynthesis Co2+ chelatase CbiK
MKITYKDFEISSWKNEYSKKYWASTSGFSVVNCKTSNKAIEKIKKSIDIFLETPITNASELANAIETTLVWTGYEDCYVDEGILKRLLDNYSKNKQDGK